MGSDLKEEAIKRAKVLMVGAGGIGCELLKTLALSGFQDVHIIDMDTIEVSNLNRQFLFRQSHVGQSKAKVARDAVLKFMPHINITPYHANVKDPGFNVDFFKQFNVVLNGLDNLDARRHVNRLCLAAEVPLIESGTTGFLGQVTVHIKGRTECYECQPKPTPKTYPVCTITSTPSKVDFVRELRELFERFKKILKFVHCIVWAKDLLFAKLFGDKKQENDLFVSAGDGSDSEKPTNIFERGSDEDHEQYGRKIYDHVFGYNIEVALANEETWKSRRRPNPIFLKDVLPERLILQNGNLEKNFLTEDLPLSAMSSVGLSNPQDVWSLADNSRVFLEALRLFFGRREKEIGNLTFDKDDQLAVEFVTSAANIRASSFGISLHSLFDAKGIAGNIVHAVATTNAIIAGLIVIEAIKVLQADFQNCRMTYCLEHPARKMLLMPVEPFEANKSCYVCSEVLVELPAPVSSGTMLTVEDLQQELSCHINIKHREEFDEDKEPDKMVLLGWTAREKESQVVSNGNSTSAAVPAAAEATMKSEEAEVNAEISGTKRKLSEISEATENQEASQILPRADADNFKNSQELEDDDDDLVVLDNYPETSKKQRLH
ncbi:hypothetical protein C4D60_Mb08t00200 [Musa balbisiana]|uniref:SUMO-activating enzyme subunit n=1 Tax=Musa balbisiana TaxID=52838 RepID=A0A4S8K080_MUSBA|nr:hypothetical protein C4D60_Mb08t00200 [Musa balbisiana]